VRWPEDLRAPGRGLHDIIHATVTVLEKAFIQHALSATHNNKKQAAKMLHLSYKTLYRKLKEHGML
jgi:DNA-binding NtrC family response regulator